MYTPDPRITCRSVEFQGAENEIHYQADCSGLPGGYVLAGEITVCSDHGEYSIPYRIEVQAEEKETPDFPFAQFGDFIAAAQEDFQKAYRYFTYPAFRGMIEKERPNLLALYDGLCIPDFSMEAMEALSLIHI